MSAALPPVATSGGQRRIRVSWIVCGIVVALAALVVTIAAGIAIVVDKAASTLDPEAEARTPGTARLDAERATYEVLLVRSRRDTSTASAANTVCTVELANEHTITLDGARQAVSTEAGSTSTIGSFDAVAGTTTVTCDAGDADLRFVVDKVSSVGRIANWVLFGGVAGLLAGAGLIVAGIFWKRTT